MKYYVIFNPKQERLRGEPNAYTLVDTRNGVLTTIARERNKTEWKTRKVVLASS